MKAVINGDNQELIDNINDNDVDKTIELLEQEYSEVYQDDDGDIICYE